MFLSPEDRAELEGWAHSRTLRAGDVMRARLILGLADRVPYRVIMRRLGITAPTISLWKRRFQESGMEGLEPQHRGTSPRKITPAVQARIVARTLKAPPDGSTQWSCRKMARGTGVSAATVHRIWRKAKWRPHRLERYMASPDPDFERKAADIIGLYLDPPQHAAVFCVDEKTAIQALDRTDPVLPLSPGRAERHGFEYYRHGTLSLYAALNVKSGKVQGKTAPRHTSKEFVDFLEQLLRKSRRFRQVHVVLDNLSAHKTQEVDALLDAYPKLKLHFTPTYSSWLNQIEIWFAQIERDVLARGVFKSVPDLARKIRRYIRAYGKTARPFQWRYWDT
ncbi:MAG: IS630 family transposase, partial [Acidobacteria bacterium]|nr:IS630 family transposase [Acidobacteriota bacterium]